MVSIALAACGDSVPGNSVASVDGDNITREQFTHWLGIAASTSQPQGSDKVAYNPPQYTACVANKKKNAPKPAKGQPQQTDAQFRTQCKQEYEGLRDQVMQFLILEKWVNGEAEDQGVKVSAAEADKEFNEAKKQSFPQEKDFQEFLKQSGMTVNDAKFQVRFNTVYTKLREKAVKGATKVSDKAVADFYEKNKARFATPATRDLRVVLTKTEDKANEAKQALEAGQSWSAVAKKYSIDQASKAQGGALLGIAKGTQEKAFDDAIFAAKKGELTGPVKTQFGYYVFQVQKITEAKQQSLKEATPAIKQQLDAQNKQKADDEFNTALRKKWKERTNCADAFVMSQCKNAPKPKTNTAAPGQPQQPDPAQR
ncbi:MAG TPA: peptidyl-prolyl cis-trans isomerase [Solirubrobacteraceae bacterium]|nr:peptidyl-prolyl cis-trans isomerase [Solirubrobacteraceae bacterium]